MARAIAKTETKAVRWVPPTSDQEFVFEGIDSLPSWADKNWAAWDGGPALAVPSGDAYGSNGPYGTKVASLGDTVVFKSATHAMSAHFEVVKGTPKEDDMTPKPPQASGASYEDLIKGGWIDKGSLSDAAKAGIAARTPSLKAFLDSDQQAPKVEVNKILITS